MADKYTQAHSQKLFEEDRARMLANPQLRKVYEEEARKKDLWLQLVEARQAADLTQQEVAKRMGVSQAQVARIERRGYEAYTLRTLRRYLKALGEDFQLDVRIERAEETPHPPIVTA